MSFDLLIRGGTVVTSTTSERADIGIRHGLIAEIGDLSMATSAGTLDASGLTVIPGIIDTQVHFREPGFEHKEDLESGTRSALIGGVTSVLEMPNTNPATTTLETLADKNRRAQGRAWCNYGFFIGATTENPEELGCNEVELARLGSPGTKIFMGSSTGSLLVSEDKDLRRVLNNGSRRCPIHAEDEKRNRERKALISLEPHPREHPFLRDAESARLATERILRLSKETGRPVHILHVSTADELPLIEEAKREGLGTTAEVTPQHLYFHAPDCYDRLGTHAQMNPPIRSKDHQKALWQAVGRGLFDVFGSDHAPHTLAEKERPYPDSPSGMPGVQTMLSVLLTFVNRGLLDMPTVVRMACERPASLYGIEGRGRIEIGYCADLTIIDPHRMQVFERSMVQSKCGWSPYEGERLTGWVEHVVLGGRVAVRSGHLQGEPSGERVVIHEPL